MHARALHVLRDKAATTIARATASGKPKGAAFMRSLSRGVPSVWQPRRADGGRHRPPPPLPKETKTYSRGPPIRRSEQGGIPI